MKLLSEVMSEVTKQRRCQYATELEEMAAKAEQESHNKSAAHQNTVAAERKLQEAQTLLQQCDQNRM